jgi:hypothetical protein
MHPASSSTSADRAIAAAAGTVAVASLGFLLSVISPTGISGLLFLVMTGAWMSAPYVLLADASLKFSTNRWSRLLLGITTAACAAFGFWSYTFVGEDAQGSFVLLMAPLYQFVAALLAAVTVYALEARASNRTSKLL